MTSVPDPDGPTSNSLWLLLVRGLLAVIILSLGVAAWITLDGNADTDPQSFFTVGTASLTGLLGLFINKP